MPQPKKSAWIVSLEWSEGGDGPPAYPVAVFIGASAERRARRFAEEQRHELRRGLGLWGGRTFVVYGDEDDDDGEWEVDVHVEAFEINPTLPQRAAAAARRARRIAAPRLGA